MKIRTAVVALLLASCSAAQDGPVRFSFSGVVSGSEEYTLSRSAAGTMLTGKTNLAQGAVAVTFTYRLAVAPDCSFQKYDLDVDLPNGKQSVSAVREGNEIKMHVTRNGEPIDKSVPFSPALLLMDNSLTGDFQLLTDCVERQKATDVTVLVPQRMATVPVKITPAGEDSGILDGKPVKARKYTLEIGPVSVSLWTNAATRELLRVANEAQNFFATRDGFVPAEKPKAAAAGNWAEREVKFPSAEFQFPATLCLPKDLQGKAPLVVLVHGSGPHDRDETIGLNKPFAEIAHTLAEAGIATLRYDKRTFAFAMSLKAATITLDQEVTDDAVAALTFAGAQSQVDASRLFVLGHSLGGTMAPYIAQKYPKLRGMILMAAGARPIDQISADQVRIQLKHEGKSDAEIQAAMQMNTDHYAMMRKAPAEQMFGGISAGYMRDWLARDPAKLLRASSMPVLVLQGGSDLQVSVADYDLLKAAITGKANSDAHLFPNLTHLFSVAPPNQTFEDIKKEAHVSPEVSKTIAEWIKKLN